MKLWYSLGVLLVFLFSFCFQKEQTTSGDSSSNLRYALEAPSLNVVMPPELSEISGLCYWDQQHLGAVQDEQGIIYKWNFETGKLSKQFSFSGEGDYEGIESKGSSLFVLKSNGTIYEYDTLSGFTKKFKTVLNYDNNCEGICYDSSSKKLLIACKGDAGTSQNSLEKGKSIYSYNLLNNTISSTPFVHFTSKKLAAWKNVFGKKRIKKIAPSGIAVHPITGYIYVLAHKGTALLVFDRQGDCLDIFALPNTLFQQPEGICFAPNGNMFIANERRDGKPATILMFKDLFE